MAMIIITTIAEYIDSKHTTKGIIRGHECRATQFTTLIIKHGHYQLNPMLREQPATLARFTPVIIF